MVACGRGAGRRPAPGRAPPVAAALRVDRVGGRAAAAAGSGAAAVRCHPEGRPAVTTPGLRLHLESTGDARFDAILGGGIPAQSVVVIAGAPGAGKTVLTLQLLFRAAREGKTGLYVTTLSEPAIKLIRYMQFFDFFDSDVLDRRIILADLGAAVRDSPERTMSELSRLVHQHEPNVIAIDSFKAVADLMPDSRTARSFAYELATQTATWGATAL